MKKSNGAKAKEKTAQNLRKTLSGYKTMAIIELSGFPSANFEAIRKTFRGKVEFVYTNKIVIYNALKGISDKLAEKTMEAKIPVLMLSNEEPFDVANVAIENKDYAKIKSGEMAPEDIVLPAGPTPFPPGPMLSQFSSIGVKTKNEAGKISIISDSTVVKKGEKVSEKVASILSSMDIRPKEIVLSMVAASNGGTIFGYDVLYTPREEYVKEVARNFSGALALSISAGIMNKYSIKPLIKKLYIGVKFLSVDRGIVSKDTIKDLLVRANVSSHALSQKLEAKT